MTKTPTPTKAEINDLLVHIAGIGMYDTRPPSEVMATGYTLGQKTATKEDADMVRAVFDALGIEGKNIVLDGASAVHYDWKTEAAEVTVAYKDDGAGLIVKLWN